MKKGFSTLIIVIVLGSMAVALSIWASTGGFLSLRDADALKNLISAQALANSCAEIALETIREDDLYTGTDEFALNGGTCEFTVSDLGDDGRQISVIAAVSGEIREIEIQTESFNPISIVSWIEAL